MTLLTASYGQIWIQQQMESLLSQQSAITQQRCIVNKDPCRELQTL